MTQKFVSVCAMTNAKDFLNKKSITMQGKIENIGKSHLDEVFIKNPYMQISYRKKQDCS